MGAKAMASTVLLLLMAGAVYADNPLVTNAGFEDLSEDGKQLQAWGLPQMPGATLAWDQEVYHGGKRSARVTGTSADDQSRFVQAWRQDTMPLPGGPLWFSVWVKAEDLEQGRINLLHRDAEGKVLRNQGVAGLSGTFDWKQIAAQVAPDPEVTSLQLVLGLQKSTGTIWFDDVSLEPLRDIASECGRLTMQASQAPIAGATAPVGFDIVVGDCGLGEGGQVRLRWNHWRPAREFRLRGFAVSCEAPAVRFETSIPPRKQSWPPTPKPVACIATLSSGSLSPGSRIHIAAELTYTPHTNVKTYLTGLIAPEVGGAPRPLAGQCPVQAIGGPAANLTCKARARPLQGNKSRLTVAATDAHGNPAEGFCDTVTLVCNTNAAIPASYTFTTEDSGSHEFLIEFPASEVSRVTATCKGMRAISNPILPRASGEPGVYFGDIHSHCEISGDAVGDPDEAYDYARRFFGMDFAALSDHSPMGERWRRAVDVANRHNDPGSFATLVGFEWSDPVKGHRNAYYRGSDGPQQPSGIGHNMQDWWDYLDEQDVRTLTVPHHPNTQAAQILANGKPAWGPMDWSVVNHKYQRVVEICQNRGSFEVPGPNEELRVVRKDCGSSVQAALAMGHRLGFIGSTDTHSGRPGAGMARAAAACDALTRDNVWDALYQRHCYATTGKHILLEFTLNGQQMGSEIALGTAATRRVIKWRAIGTAPIKRVDLLRNNQRVRAWQGKGGDDLSGSFEADEALGEPEWWYLRVIQEDTEMAWSSPIWVDPPGQEDDA